MGKYAPILPVSQVVISAVDTKGIQNVSVKKRQASVLNYFHFLPQYWQHLEMMPQKGKQDHRIQAILKNRFHGTHTVWSIWGPLYPRYICCTAHHRGFKSRLADYWRDESSVGTTNLNPTRKWVSKESIQRCKEKDMAHRVDGAHTQLS